MQTPEDYLKAIQDDSFDNESASEACFKLACKMVIEFAFYLRFLDAIPHKDGSGECWTVIEGGHLRIKTTNELFEQFKKL